MTKKSPSKHVEIEILGQKYTLKGEADVDYLKAVASYVDGKLRSTHAYTSAMPPVKAAIMAAITITDELFKLRAEQQQLQTLIDEKTEELQRILDIETSDKK